MGLDMYVYRVRKENTERLAKAGRMEDIQDLFLPRNEENEVYYWRKHHDLHQFFESYYENVYPKEEYQDPEDPLKTGYFNVDQYVQIRNSMLHDLEYKIGYVYDEENDRFVKDDDNDNRYDCFDYYDGFLTPENDYEFIFKAREILNAGDGLIYTSWW